MNTQPKQTNFYNPNQPAPAAPELKLVPTSNTHINSDLPTTSPTLPKLPSKTKNKLVYLLLSSVFVLTLAGTAAGIWLSNQNQEVRRQAAEGDLAEDQNSCSMVLNVLPPQQCNEYCNTVEDCPPVESGGNQIVYECFENKCRNLYNPSSETCEYLNCPCPTDLSAEYEVNGERFFVNLTWTTPEPLAHWENYTPKYKIFRNAQQIESMYEGNSYQDDNDGAGFTSAGLAELEYTVLVDETEPFAHCSTQGCSTATLVAPSNTPTPSPTSTPTPTVTPPEGPTATPTPTSPSAPSATPTPTNTPVPNAPTATSTPTATPTPTRLPTPTPNPTLAASCNEPCTTNADCSNSQHICYSVSSTNNVCRLGSNPTNDNCQPPQPTTPPTATPRPAVQPTTQPPMPTALPETGPEDWLNYLKTGLAILGVSMALLLML